MLRRKGFGKKCSTIRARKKGSQGVERRAVLRLIGIRSSHNCSEAIKSYAKSIKGPTFESVTLVGSSCRKLTVFTSGFTFTIVSFYSLKNIELQECSVESKENFKELCGIKTSILEAFKAGDLNSDRQVSERQLIPLKSIQLNHMTQVSITQFSTKMSDFDPFGRGNSIELSFN